MQIRYSQVNWLHNTKFVTAPKYYGLNHCLGSCAIIYYTHVRYIDEGELPWLVDVPGTRLPYATPYENYPILYVAIFVLTDDDRQIKQIALPLDIHIHGIIASFDYQTTPMPIL